MMSQEAIRAQADQAASRASSEGRKPATFDYLGHDGIRAAIRKIPFIGDYRPKGWKRVDVTPPRALAAKEGYLFVDSSGLGRKDEPALTVSEFVDFIYNHREYGYAIVEVGQFQVVVAAYERVPVKRQRKEVH